MEECAEQEVIIPDSVQQQINNLNSDWEIIQKLAAEMKPVSKEKMEVITQGTNNKIENGMGNMSKRQQPDQRVENSRRSAMGLQNSENMLQPEASSSAGP